MVYLQLETKMSARGWKKFKHEEDSFADHIDVRGAEGAHVAERRLFINLLC